MGELKEQLERILADYLANRRQPGMVLDVLAALTREVEKEWGVLPFTLQRVRSEIGEWQAGRHQEREALETILTLVCHR